MTVRNITTDILVIGGGINGVGIARDLAGRGASVVLCEQGDLASGTSSASTKIIHGGLRYLEQFNFKLVRDSLIEREILLRSAPHLITPMDFVLPHNKKLRPYWMIRLGLFLYDYLGPRDILPGSEGLNFKNHPTGLPLKDACKRGVMYSDCWTDDARLVITTAVDARDRGAEILTRSRCKSVRKKRGSHIWRAMLEDHITKRETFVDAKLVVNAAGPWVDQVIDGVDKEIADHHIRMVKGSHIIVPKMYEGNHAYILQNTDKRIVFAIPYEGLYTLIGTTDVDYTGNPGDAEISGDEVQYLCRVVNGYFKSQIKPEDIVWSYSGVRALADEGKKDKASQVTRDYILEMKEHAGLPILSVYGGKLTTFRKLSEQAANMIMEKLGRKADPWTEFAVLPGGNFKTSDFDMFFKTFCREFEWLPREIAMRYCRTYGTRARYFLRGARQISDLGEHLGGGIYEAEIAYLVLKEWATTMEDILWRRSKWGLHIPEETEKNISRILRKYKKRFATIDQDTPVKKAIQQ
ncbi:MAG: glycerol-3-phosphate dehydrogenase [Pseudomonadota bacterium]